VNQATSGLFRPPPSTHSSISHPAICIHTTAHVKFPQLVPSPHKARHRTGLAPSVPRGADDARGASPPSAPLHFRVTPYRLPPRVQARNTRRCISYRPKAASPTQILRILSSTQTIIIATAQHPNKCKRGKPYGGWLTLPTRALSCRKQDFYCRSTPTHLQHALCKIISGKNKYHLNRFSS